MGRQLNIKDEETIRLAKELADASGETVTETIRKALKREHQQRHRKVEEIMAAVRKLSAEFRANMPPEWRGRTARQIVNDFHEEEWREQYGPDA